MKTTITKALENKIIDAVTRKANEKTMQKLQNEWLYQNMYKVYKKECKEEKHYFPTKEFVNILEDAYIFPEMVDGKKKFYLKNFSFTMSLSRGWMASKGDYEGTNAQLFDTYNSLNFTWVPPTQVLAYLQKIDEIIPQWIEQDWPAIIMEAQKKAKMRSMSENTIQTMVTMKMKGSGIPFSFVKQKTRVKVIFDVGHGQMMTMALYHKKFPEQIDQVINTAKTIKALMDETSSPISMKKLDKYIDWENPGSEEQ